MAISHISLLTLACKYPLVHSSLLQEPKSEWVQPRVSPYRLATHLTSAFVIYSGILWTALSVVMPEPPSGSLNWVHGATKIRKLALPVSFIVGLTAVSGAFVAGNDAVWFSLWLYNSLSQLFYLFSICGIAMHSCRIAK